MSKLKFFLLALGFSLSIPFLGFAEDTLTITTYYPSPYGVYREMRSMRMAIGDDYIDNTVYCWEGTCTNIVDPNADLVVEGNVGIGTTNPLAPLDIKSNGTAATSANLLLRQNNSTGDGWEFQANTVDGGLSISRRDTNATLRHEDVRIDSMGDVGIGTTSPYNKLHVYGFDLANGMVLGARPNVAGEISAYFYVTNSGNGILNIQAAKTSVGGGVIALNPTGGSVGIGTTSSSDKLSVNGSIMIENTCRIYTRSGACTSAEATLGTDPNNGKSLCMDCP